MFGNSPRGLTVGEFARRVGASVRTVEWWVERGFLNAEGIGNGPGSRRRIPVMEVPIATRVVECTTRLGVRASERLFEVMRQESPQEPERMRREA
jgi:hypothetical protein